MEYKNLTLDPFQAEAIEYVKERRSVLVSAPTGVGKTIIADFIVEQSLKNNESVIYTAPIKALSNQKYREFTRDHGVDAIGLITGDLVLNPNAPILIMTTEILRNMLLQHTEVTQNLAYVIFDEIHFLGDLDRGTVWEETLIYLPKSVKILGLSATISNINEFSRWLSFIREDPIAVIVEKDRKVPLEILIGNYEAGVLNAKEFRRQYDRKIKQLQRNMEGMRERDYRFSHAYSKTGTRHYRLIEMIRDQYLPCLYFVFSRRLAELYAKELERKVHRSFLNPDELSLLDSHLREFSNTHNFDLSFHAPMYRKGIAFHHAGLNVRLKWLVEHLYENRLIKVLYCTSTFALGMNMPAKTVLFDEIRKYDGRSVAPLSTLQFMQKAGRAGRRGMDEKGFVIIKQDFADFVLNQPFLANYEKGSIERIESTFNLSFNSIVNLISIYSIEDIKTIIQKSYRNFKRRDIITQINQELTTLRQEMQADETVRCAPSQDRRAERIAKLDAEIESKKQLIQKVFEEATRHFVSRRKILEQMELYERLMAMGGNISQTLRLLHSVRTEPNRTKEDLRIIIRLERGLDEDSQKLTIFKEDILGLERLKAFESCNDCLNYEACLNTPKRKFPKRLNELYKRLRKEERRIFKDFFDKLQMLEEIGYISDQLEILAGGQILKNVQIEEILVTEMILEGIFEGLSSEEVFAVCASVCYTFPRSEHIHIKLSERLQALDTRISNIQNGHHVILAERTAGIKYIYCHEMLHLGHLWASGYTLQELNLMLNTETDISGDLINAFRRGRDLLRQLKDVYRSDSFMNERLSHAIWLISRDEVNVID